MVMSTARHVRIHQEGDHQTVEIPADLKMPGDEAVIHKEGDKLILEPVRRKSLSKLLAILKPLDEEWPEIEDLPAEPVDLGFADGELPPEDEK
jgi:antitoxin VapB